MAEYIERGVASEKLYDVYEYVKRNIIADGKPVDAPLVKNIMLRFEKALMNVPAADVAPVVHAHWVDDRDGIDIAFGECDPDCHCSACGNRSDRYFKYCPRCGAKMDQEVSDEQSD